MPTPRHPEDLPPQAGGELPDLAMRELGRDGSFPQEDALDNNPTGDKPDLQSVFSKRSGIQDPLIRSREDDDVKGEPRAEVEAENAAPTGPQAEPGATEADDPDEAAPLRKGRKTKGQPRLVKSKRHLDRARRRQKNYLQQRREKKKLRVFYLRIRMIFKLCFALIWCVLLWELVHSPLWLFNQPRFSVSNAHLIQPTQMAPMVKRLVGKPIYAINTGKLAAKIKNSFDIVNLVVVRRQLFPTRLEIWVQEKQPWAELYATDPNPPQKPLQGEPTGAEASTKKVPPKLAPPAYGLMVPNGIVSLSHYHYRSGLFGPKPLEKLIVTPKTVFSFSYLEQLQNLVWQAHQIKGLHLLSVDLRNPNRIVLNYQELPVVLGKLNATASERLARLIPLVPKIEEYREGMDSVDLQWEEQVTFHQKPNAKLDLPKPEQAQG